MKPKGAIEWVSRSDGHRSTGRIREIVVHNDHIGITIYDPNHDQTWSHVLMREADHVSGQLTSSSGDYIATIDAHLTGEGELAGIWSEAGTSPEDYDFKAQWDEGD